MTTTIYFISGGLAGRSFKYTHQRGISHLAAVDMATTSLKALKIYKHEGYAVVESKNKKTKIEL